MKDASRLPANAEMEHISTLNTKNRER